MPAVGDKRETNRLFEAGAYGNTIGQWASPDDAVAAGYRGRLGVRSYRPGSPHCRYDLSAGEAAAWIGDCEGRGAPRGSLYVTAYMTGQLAWITLNAEVYRGVGGLQMHYSTAKLVMRPALAASGLHASGLAAKLILQRHLDPASYETLTELLDTFDDAPGAGMQASHVAEVSAFDRWVGDVPGRNTIIWELRAY